MQNKFKLAVTLSTLLAVNFTVAEEIPVPSTYDSRVQEVIYNPANVTLVKVQTGTATLIQLSDKEFIGDANSGFAIGDPLAWDISVKQNNIFIRPKAAMPDTNVVFTTNKRTYVLNLVSAENGKEEPTFYLKYKYPQDEKEEREKLAYEQRQKAKKQREQAAIKNAPKIPPCTNSSYVNLDYSVRGSADILPYIIWDDGEFTCMKWDSTKELPIVYKQLKNGQEVLTNTHMDKTIMVIHEVSPNYVLRYGDSVAEVKTNSIRKIGYNNKGTTVRNQSLQKIN